MSRYVTAVIHSTFGHYDVDDDLKGADDAWMSRRVTVVDMVDTAENYDVRMFLDGWVSPLAALRELNVTHVAKRLLITCNEYDRDDLPIIFKARRLDISLEEAERGTTQE